MKTTTVCKANDDLQEIKDQIIIIGDEIPPYMPLEECEKFYERQADAIDKVLSESLPQGTYDRLGMMFMQRKVTLYQGRTGT